METYGVIGVIALGLVIVVGSLLVTRHQENKRRTAMRGLAGTHGWQWTDEDRTFTRQWEGEPFGAGRTRRATNILVGRYADTDIVVLDYSYVTGGGKSSTHHRYTVWAVRMRAALPRLELGPEGMLGGRVAAMFGMSDLQVGDPAFDSTYKVRSADEAFGRDLLRPELVGLLTRADPVELRIDGNTLLTWEQGRVDTAAIVPRLDFLCDVVRQVPSVVWERYGTSV